MDISPVSDPPLHRRVFLYPEGTSSVVAIVNDLAARDTSAERIPTGRTRAERARAGCTRIERT